MDLPSAVGQVMDESFDPETADPNGPAIRTLLGFMETVGTFVKQGVLDAGLVDDLFWVEGIWSRIGPAALRERARMGEPRLFENIERLASRS